MAMAVLITEMRSRRGDERSDPNAAGIHADNWAKMTLWVPTTASAQVRRRVHIRG
jgi:hypothetical protein